MTRLGLSSLADLEPRNKKGEVIIRLRHRFPQISSERHSELIANDWIQLREPNNLVSIMLAAIPLIILCALPSLKIFDIFSPFSLTDYGITLLPPTISITIYFTDLAWFLVCAIGLIFIHELMHLVFVPDFLNSDKTFLGITYFGGFAYSEEALSKSRFILTLLTPYVVISIILPGILGALNILNPLVKFLLILHAMSSGVDMLGLILLLTQVPSGVYLTCNGTKTYWKRINKKIPENN